MEVVALPRAIHVKAKQEEAHCSSDVCAMVRDNMQVRPQTSSITYACVYIHTYVWRVEHDGDDDDDDDDDGDDGDGGDDTNDDD